MAFVKNFPEVPILASGFIVELCRDAFIKACDIIPSDASVVADVEEWKEKRNCLKRLQVRKCYQ
jgi:hypothetical protein